MRGTPSKNPQNPGFNHGAPGGHGIVITSVRRVSLHWAPPPFWSHQKPTYLQCALTAGSCLVVLTCVGVSRSFLLCVNPQLQNQSELRAPTAEKAAFFLDAAIASRRSSQRDCDEEDHRNSHMLFTLHIYQYRMEKSGKGGSKLSICSLWFHLCLPGDWL